jgi:copper(I)-binding protein
MPQGVAYPSLELFMSLPHRLRAAARRSFLPGFSRNSAVLLGLAACLGLEACLGLGPLPTHAHDYKIGSLHLDHPWSRATPGGASVAAGYVIISNMGDKPDRLLAANVEIADKTEIHEMAMKESVMTMRPLPDGLPVPAQGDVALKPGSFHLMFVGLKRPLKQGERFAGTLTFEQAGTVNVMFAVEAIGATAPAPEDKDMPEGQ